MIHLNQPKDNPMNIKAIPQGEPLIFTSLGNVPESTLDHRPHWEDHPGATVFVDEWFHAGVSVKRSVHALSKTGVTGEAIAAPLTT